MKNFLIFKEAVGDAVDILLIAKDFGNQEGPTIDPRLVREMFFPYIKKFASFVKENSNYYLMLHSCGSIYEFIPDIIDCGIDIYHKRIAAVGLAPDPECPGTR